MSSSHTTDVLVIMCMDFRLHRHDPPQLADFLHSLGLHTWDLRTQQGGVKDLLPTVVGAQKDSLLAAVRISRDLHGVQTILLMNHTDCGAYGGAKAFTNAAEEREAHVHDLCVATEEMARIFPEMRTQAVLADIGSGVPPPVTFSRVPLPVRQLAA
jgi:carbonic anhydrase